MVHEEHSLCFYQRREASSSKNALHRRMDNNSIDKAAAAF